MRVLLLVTFLSFLCFCETYDMIIGDTVHRKMVFHQRVKDFAIPFKKRIKLLTYNDPEKRIIKVINMCKQTEFCNQATQIPDADERVKIGVAAIDNDFSHASANITAGGVGFSYVTVRMKSQRHHPLNFEVEIYV